MAFTTFPTTGPYAPEDLTGDLNTNFGKVAECSFSTLVDGELLSYNNSSGLWINTTPAEVGANITLENLGNVSLSTLSDGEVLTWNSSSNSWINGTATSASTITVEDDGTSIVASATTLDFTGAGVTVTDTGSGQATVNIPGPSADVFHAKLSATVTNVTGDGTDYTIVFNTVESSASWASLNTGTGVVTLDPGTYMVSASVVSIDDAGATTKRLIVSQDGTDIARFWTTVGSTNSVGGSLPVVVTGTSNDEISVSHRVEGTTLKVDLVAGTSTFLRIVKLA